MTLRLATGLALAASGVLVAGLLTHGLPPASPATAATLVADTPCSQWNVSGIWHGWDWYSPDATWNLSQSGTTITGQDVLPMYLGSANKQVTGTLVGDKLTIYDGSTQAQDTHPGTVRSDGLVIMANESSGDFKLTGTARCVGFGAAGGCNGFAGTWNTEFGTMQLDMSGGTMTGTYDYMGGKVSGTVSGNTLTGTWSQRPSFKPPNDAGDLKFTLDTGGGSFHGQWRYGSSGDWSNWNGTCELSGSSSTSSGSSSSSSSTSSTSTSVPGLKTGAGTPYQTCVSTLGPLNQVVPLALFSDDPLQAFTYTSGDDICRTLAQETPKGLDPNKYIACVTGGIKVLLQNDPVDIVTALTQFSNPDPSGDTIWYDCS